MPKYVKNDVVDRPYFTAGKAYEVERAGPRRAVIVDDEGCLTQVTAGGVRSMASWKWCDKEGNLK